MPKITNWTKLDRMTYQYEPNPEIELRFLNSREVADRGLGWRQWMIAIFINDELDRVVVDDLPMDEYHTVRKAAVGWMRFNQHLGMVV